MSESWINHPTLSHISVEKLLMLKELSELGNQKSITELLPFLSNALRAGKKSGLSFSEQEINAILKVLKENKSPGEIRRMEKIISTFKTLNI